LNQEIEIKHLEASDLSHASVKWVHKPLIIYYGNVDY
jgi:hypothetical protein